MNAIRRRPYRWFGTILVAALTWLTLPAFAQQPGINGAMGRNMGGGCGMMGHHMMGGMWVMGLVGILIIVVLLLSAAALIKYLIKK